MTTTTLDTTLLELTASRLHQASIAVEALGNLLCSYDLSQRPPHVNGLILHGMGAALVMIAQDILTDCRETIEVEEAPAAAGGGR